MNESSELEPLSTFAWIVWSAVWPCFLSWMLIPWWLKNFCRLSSRLFAWRTSLGTLRWNAST